MRALALAFLVFLISKTAVIADPIRLSRNENSLNNLILSRIIQIVYDRAGIEVEMVDLPAKRGTLLLQLGEIDGAVSRVARYGNSRDYLIRLEPPINQIDTTVFVRADTSLDIQSTADLANLTVGVVGGIVHARNAARGAADVTEADNIARLMSMLRVGRVDIAIHSRFAGALELRRAGLTDVRALDVSLGTVNTHHYLRTSFAAEAAQIEAVLRQMMQSGEFAALFAATQDSAIAQYLDGALFD